MLTQIRASTLVPVIRLQTHDTETPELAAIEGAVAFSGARCLQTIWVNPTLGLNRRLLGLVMAPEIDAHPRLAGVPKVYFYVAENREYFITGRYI